MRAHALMRPPMRLCAHVQDLDAPSFERQALGFMNDVLFYEASGALVGPVGHG